MGDEKQRKMHFLGLSVRDWRLVAVVWIVALVIIGGLFLMRRTPQPTLKVAYLYPLNEPVHNIWIAPLDNPAAAQQMTDLPLGVYDFGVSPDGKFIAYSTRAEATRQLDIYLFNLETGQSRQLTFCGAEDAECSSPVFHPDGTVIAYQKEALRTLPDGDSHIAPRIWLLDIASGVNQPLAGDPQMISFAPVWSDNGISIAFFTTTPDPQGDRVGIVLYNFNPDHLHQSEQDNPDHPEQNLIPATQGSVGAIAPDGLRLIFPDMVAREGGYYSHLKIVDLTQNPPSFTDFTDSQAPIDDLLVDWHPDGQFVTVERRYLDERFTAGFQLYNIDVETQAITPLLVDETYSHHYFEWEQSGQYLVVQRIRQQEVASTTNSADNRPEIWVLNSDNGALTRIATEAYHPRWVASE